MPAPAPKDSLPEFNYLTFLNRGEKSLPLAEIIGAPNYRPPLWGQRPARTPPPELVTTAKIKIPALTSEELQPGTIASSAQIHATARVAPTAIIGAEAVIGPGVRVDDYAVIGPGCNLGAGVVVGAQAGLGPNNTLHEKCLLHPGVILGGGNVLGVQGGAHYVTLLSQAIIGDNNWITGGTLENYSIVLSENQIGPGLRAEVAAIIGDNNTLGPKVKLGLGVEITGRSVIGAETQIDFYTKIGPGFRAGEQCLIVSEYKIDENVKLGRGVKLMTPGAFIWKNCSFAANCKIATLTVRNDVVVGENSVLPYGINIDEKCHLAANTNLTKETPGVKKMDYGPARNGEYYYAVPAGTTIRGAGAEKGFPGSGAPARADNNQEKS